MCSSAQEQIEIKYSLTIENLQVTDITQITTHATDTIERNRNVDTLHTHSMQLHQDRRGFTDLLIDND